MTAFTLTTHDPNESYDIEPTTLMPLREWMPQFQAGQVRWHPEFYAGIGIRLRDGTSDYLQERWGSATHLARNCEVAADRLSADRIAILRNAIDDAGCYVLLVPNGPVVRPVQVVPALVPALERPPCGDVFPYHPSEAAGESPADVAALYAWAEEQAEHLLAPTKPRVDRRRGKLLRLPTDELVDNLRTEAEVARQADKMVQDILFG